MAKIFFEETTLLLASKNGHVHTVRDLIKAGADVNVQNSDGETSLYLACQKGHVDVVKALIKAKADIHGKNELVLTPLNAAVRNGYTDIVNLLIEAGANIHMKDNNGHTSLYFACINGYVNIVTSLIKAGADINADDALFAAAYTGPVNVVELLIEAGANVNMQDKGGRTPIYIAVQRNHEDIVRALIKAGAITDDIRNLVQYVPLIIFAAHQRSLNITKLLIEAGANVNVTKPSDDFGCTALHIATFKNRVHIVEALLEAGADINIANSSGESALHRVISFRNRDYNSTIELLISHIVRLDSAGLYISEGVLEQTDYYMSPLYESRNEYFTISDHARCCTKEIEKLRRENIALYEFLTENDSDHLCNIWEMNVSVSSKFNNHENLYHQYPEYSYILMNKANEVRKKIFLHNHRPLVDVLSMHHRHDVKGMTFTGIRRFFTAYRADFKEKLGNGGLCLGSFVDFQDIEERHIPKLKVWAFKKFVCNSYTK